MHRKEFVKRVTEVLRENNIKKPVSIPKQVFHISDDEGNSKDFFVKKSAKDVIFTLDDVDSILGACIYVVKEAIRKGEPITIHGFGTIDVRYRKPRSTKQIGTGEEVAVAGRFVPKFTFGSDLRLSARIYEASLGESYVPPDEAVEDGDLDAD